MDAKDISRSRYKSLVQNDQRLKSYDDSNLRKNIVQLLNFVSFLRKRYNNLKILFMMDLAI